MQDKIFLDLAGNIRTRDEIEDMGGPVGDTVDLTQSED